MDCLFKVWTKDRMQKRTVVAKNNIKAVIEKASNVLNVAGRKLVYEVDGTDVDDQTLEFLTMDTRRPTEIFILLQLDETWTPSVTEEQNDRNNNSCTVISGTDKDKFISNEASISFSISNASDENSVSSDQEIVASPAPERRILQNEDEPGVESPRISLVNWNNFKIKWPGPKEPYRAELEAGRRDTFIVKEFVRSIVSQLMNFSQDIPQSVFADVGKQMFHDFLKMFGDFHDHGEVFGSGCVTVIKKLNDRYSYILRFKKGLNKSLHVPFNMQRCSSQKRFFISALQDANGPSNFSPGRKLYSAVQEAVDVSGTEI